MALANLWRNRKRTVMVICSLTLGLVLMSFFYAKNASFDVEKYLMDLTVADYEIDDATNNISSGYDPASQTINDELLSAVGKLTAEYGKIGGNLNQIARCLNEYGAPYNALSQEVRATTAELAALKFEVLQKVGEAVGNIQTYQL